MRDSSLEGLRIYVCDEDAACDDAAWVLHVT
jgi:hypothetical protein